MAIVISNSKIKKKLKNNKVVYSNSISNVNNINWFGYFRNDYCNIFSDFEVEEDSCGIYFLNTYFC